MQVTLAFVHVTTQHFNMQGLQTHDLVYQ